MMTENQIKKQLPDLGLPQKPVYKKLKEDFDFFELFCTLEKECECCFLLESLGEGTSDSRYSVIGFDPDAVIKGKEGILQWTYRRGETIEISADNPYNVLSNWTRQDIISRNYTGGLVGYMGYDCANFFEPVLQLQFHESFEPFIFGVYCDGLILDKMTGEIYYFHYGDDRSEYILSRMQSKKMKSEPPIVKELGRLCTKEDHRLMVDETLEEIRSGNTFQCQIGFREEYEIIGNPGEVYRILRSVSPSPYMFFLKFHDRIIIGASPELLFRLRQGEIDTYPLAGTTKRGKTFEEDIKLARDLLNDPKEIAEHNMLVDLHRNDLGRVARFGTVKARRLMDAKKFSHVQHISSEVAGIIHKNFNMFDGLRSVYPAGTLSGAPKIESMKIIERIEKSPRGPYGGTMGHFGWNGDCTFAILIRTLFIKGNRAFARASSGIVYDSIPDNEYLEIERKLAAMRKTLEKFIHKHRSGEQL